MSIVYVDTVYVDESLACIDSLLVLLAGMKFPEKLDSYGHLFQGYERALLSKDVEGGCVHHFIILLSQTLIT